MLGWALGFFAAAIIAAMFGFGVVASTFAGVAMILFWVFVGLTVVSLLLSLFGTGPARLAEGGHLSSGGTSLGGLAALAFVAVAAVLAYAWVQNDWSAETAGRAIDQSATQITADARDALHGAGDRAQDLIQNTGDELRHDTAQGLDQAQKTVAPDQSQNSDR